MPRIDTPIVWTIAGSDPGGGAGIQADLKTIGAFGVHGCSVITAATAQNTHRVEAVHLLSPKAVRDQIETLASDLPPTVVKTGMLGSPEICRIVGEYLGTFNVPVVCDPVLRSTSGTGLFDATALDAYKHHILPITTLLTPNLPEAELLLGADLPVDEAARQLLKLGPASILVKGGHADGDQCRDFWSDGKTSMWLSSPRIDTRHTHGTGCILASAIATALALGQETANAVVVAKTFLNQCLKSPANIGAGHGPMLIQPFRNDSGDSPNVAYK